MYKVLVAFTDLQDNDHKYLPGNTYPRKGLNPSPERIVELSTTANKRHIKLIESDGTDVIKAVKEDEKPVEEAAVVEEVELNEADEPENDQVEETAEAEDFMNPPVESSEPVEAPKKRGRKKNAD